MTFTATTIRKLRALNLDQETFDAVLAIFEEARESKPKRKGSAADRQERGTRLSADWALPDDWRLWAEKAGLRSGEVAREAVKFKNYWTSQNGPKAIKLRWDSTWRNWIISTLERLGRPFTDPSGAPPASGSSSDPGKFDETTWRAIALRFKKTEIWNPEWGPHPGQMDCLMPAGLL